MKQLQLSQELIQRIKDVVGPDTDTTNLSVFEAIALNTHPLPGKDGTIFEKARVSTLTLRQMVDSINGGNSLPLIFNHDQSEGPSKGRVFYAEMHVGETGEDEMRVLFYVDGTETQLVQKLNAGSLDEVSVAFLASQILCSECSFDYRGPEASFTNLFERKCDKDHQIGVDGVHTRLVGLSVFSELSLVNRGAAKEAKIVGKSQSKLAAPLQQLAAKGFEIDRLYLTASKGELTVDNSLVTMLADTKAEVLVLKKQTETDATAITNLTAGRDTLSTEKAELETQLAAAKAESKADELATATTELTEAKTVLIEMFTKLATANGETNVVAPDSIADLKAGIEERQSKLTAILPVGGAGTDSKNETQLGAKFRGTAGFKVGR